MLKEKNFPRECKAYLLLNVFRYSTERFLISSPNWCGGRRRISRQSALIAKIRDHLIKTHYLNRIF